LEFLSTLVSLTLEIDRHLLWLVQNYGAWVYLVLFLIIFCETGLVVTPFLPGDSLLFVAGTLAAGGDLYVHGLFAALALASFLGDNTNYWIGRVVGPRVFTRRQSWAFNPAYLEYTQRFYEKHGPQTIVIARFVPIVRTFAPFVAGMGRMRYGRFVFYSFSGSVLWISSLTYAGYFFGTIPAVQQNLTLVIIGIVILSIMPGVVGYLRTRQRS
jgi:membrane-associated protein